ncbi:MAG TPA: thiamine-phosphate kinase [Helicobacteraceae bacterium]|nr:thiamine-phosphate kinase [Helicobacteraceae bacterium]
MNKEHYFIAAFSSKNIGDDGAVIDGMVYTKDAFFENVHFKREWMRPYEIATKAMMVNISDAIAMNARPKYALLSVAIPSDMTPVEMKELAQGFEDCAEAFGIEIIGGDTLANTKLDITVTVVSQTQRPLYRTGLKKGDLIAYTGDVGKSATALKRLLSGSKLHKQSKFHNIELRHKFMEHVGDTLRVGMDISDGLFSDLDKLARLNRLGFSFSRQFKKSIGCSGEEYEMLIGFDKRQRKRLIRYAQKSRTPLNIFAKAVRGNYVNRCKAHHF